MRYTPDPISKPTLVARVEIAQAAVDAFVGRPFAWGENDCARLAASVLRAAGYRPNLAQFGAYRTDRAARKALRSRKMSSVVDWIDSVRGLSRVAPAATLPGDLIAFPGVGGWEGLGVVLGNGRVLAFTEAVEAGGCAILDANLGLAVAAWKVDPCRNS